ncbi:major facilitator superfamily domain-containing protein [Phascolomyces articulosus]|uniref:Major facilitator superfamily domain-containing protein n=1 Tax=Phascolomyces articulosus TaxID=60185 RepID=A0AAD5PHB7_9FUNG|nr:major facilitator superfamily domain-containing protein [Phascolomyces articulosus]
MEETIKYEPSIQQENKVIRKINRVAVPFMLLIMFFQQLDKMTLNYSAMLGIYNDVNLTHDEFGLAGSLYFLAQMIFQATIVIYSLQQYPISKVLGIAMFCWSLSIIGTAFVNNFTQLALCRFILGAFEAFTYPSLFLFIKTHYRRSEQGTYLALVYISLCVAIMCGSFFTYGIGQIVTEFMHGRGNWAWSMVIYGAVTLCFSIVVFFYLPDTPYSKRFNLSEQEKEIVSARIRDNNILHVSNIQWEQIFESIKETRYWSLVILTALSNLPNGAIATFSSQLIRDLGFSKLNSIILNVPRPMWEIVTYLIFIFTTTRIHWCKKHVAYTNAFFMLIPTLGVVLLRAIPVGEAFIIRLIGICITPTTFATLTGQALVSSNVAGKTKMIFYTTTVTMANTLGHFLGGLMIRQNEYPGYSSALSGYITADIVTILLLAFIGWSYQNDNQLRQKKQYASIVEGDDLTDVQLQHHFIYRP